MPNLQSTKISLKILDVQLFTYVHICIESFSIEKYVYFLCPILMNKQNNNKV